MIGGGSFPPFEEERSRGKGERGCVLSAIGGRGFVRSISGYNVCLHNRDAPTFALLIPSSGVGARWAVGGGCWPLLARKFPFFFSSIRARFALDTGKKIRREINDKMFRASFVENLSLWEKISISSNSNSMNYLHGWHVRLKLKNLESRIFPGQKILQSIISRNYYIRLIKFT